MQATRCIEGDSFVYNVSGNVATLHAEAIPEIEKSGGSMPIYEITIVPTDK